MSVVYSLRSLSRKVEIRHTPGSAHGIRFWCLWRQIAMARSCPCTLSSGYGVIDRSSTRRRAFEGRLTVRSPTTRGRVLADGRHVAGVDATKENFPEVMVEDPHLDEAAAAPN